ncbi:MAG TPA: hypothetical protein EYP08_03130 [Pyrodictiaceae archaeon]|nr:hypothetical protein [Pyrodictiaceae archaeon]
MVREKVERVGEYRIIVYDDARWRLLANLRREAMKIMEALVRAGLPCIVHGSIARGDVKPSSDIDVFVPIPVPSYRIELALEAAGYDIRQKLIVQATPSSTPKAYLVLDVEEKYSRKLGSSL